MIASRSSSMSLCTKSWIRAFSRALVIVLLRAVFINFKEELACSTVAVVTGMTRSTWRIKVMLEYAVSLHSARASDTVAGRALPSSFASFHLHCYRSISTLSCSAQRRSAPNPTTSLAERSEGSTFFMQFARSR